MERAVVLLATPKAAGGKQHHNGKIKRVRHQEEQNQTNARIATIQYQLVALPYGNANHIK
jgi:hypothetical protein